MNSEERLLTDRTLIFNQFPRFKDHWGEHIFVYTIGGEIVAEGELKFCPDEQLIEIKMVETIEKRKGYGTKFVNHLRTLEGYNELWGEAVPDAVPFWLKKGAKFEEESFEEYVKFDEYYEGFLVPFTISC